jgi:CRP/FNR family transcriptional regulator, cyclic AMP receptor protein
MLETLNRVRSGLSSYRGVRLLDVEPEFGAGLSPPQYAQARDQVVMPSAELPRGPVALRSAAEAAGARGRVLGLLVLDGALTHDLRLLDRVCTRLLVAGDLVLFDGEPAASLPSVRSWSVAQRAHVAILDHRLLASGTRWPLLLGAVLERAAQQDRLGLTQQAISQLPRVEDRLLAFFWMIADRRGHVGQEGVRFSLHVTHEALGRMIGARRPTVSLGLTALAEAGLLQSHGDDWVLSPESAERLAADDQANAS